MIKDQGNACFLANALLETQIGLILFFKTFADSCRFFILFILSGFCSVVVITFASHAKGPRFETWQKHSFENYLANVAIFMNTT